MARKKNENVLDKEVVQDEEIVEMSAENEDAVEQSGSDLGNSPDGSAENDLEKLEAENRACQDKLLRLAAEFENYKKRMIRDRQTYVKYAEENILKDLLPSIDNLERAIEQDESTRNVETLLEGVELTLKGLQTTVSKYGLVPIESVGLAFDPNLHEALVMESSDEVPAQSVLREFEKGYHYKDRLLRAAKVVVSKGQE